MYASSSMDEKTLVEEDDEQQQQQQIIIRSPLPPSYDSTVHTPPPPTYLQSTTRLYYKNQPYISDFDELSYRQEHERQRNENQSDTWSEIAQLPLHRRFNYYIASWGNTVYDGRLIFFSFFIFASFTVMAIVVSVVVIPSLLLKH
jgi:hypothetical protein